MVETIEKTASPEVVLILKAEDPAILNNQYKKHTEACMALLHEIELLPEIQDVENYNFVQGRLKEINKSYLVKIENRKKITRILDLGISRLMEGEKLIGNAISKWREKMLFFQLEEKRKSDAKILEAKKVEQRLAAINNAVKQCQLALESIILKRKKGIVIDIDSLLLKIREQKSIQPMVLAITDALDKERDTILSPILKPLSKEISDEVKNRLNRCEEYGLISFHFRMEHELDNLLAGCIGNPEEQDGFLNESNEEKFQKAQEEVSKRFKNVYPELNLSTQAKVEKIELKAAVNDTRAALGTIAASQPELNKGVSDNLEVVIQTREQLLQALAYYLDKTGPDGLTRVFNSLSFVLTLLNKERPPLPGVLYQEKRKVSLR